MNIVYFDIESTGLSTWRDKIISITFYYEGKTKTFLCNPGVPIPLEASRIHGIYDNHVADLPGFNYYALQISQILQKADMIAGYNVRNFDLPMLQTELLRCGYEIPKGLTVIDVYELTQSLFKSLKLSDIYRVICGKELKGAHDSKNDVLATVELHEELINKYLS